MPRLEHTTAKGPKSDYFPALTGLRAVAAGLVLLHHFNPFSPARFGWRLHNLVAEAHVGVTIFFVLSGFLIGYRYLGQRVALRTYFANRFARIYPIFFLLTTLSFAARQYKGHPFYLSEYLLNITFLRGLFAQHIYSGIPQGWSLTVEEMFYLSAPLAFGLIRRSRQWLWGMPLGLVGLGAVAVLLCHGLPWHGFLGSFGFLFRFTYLGRATEFFVGVALAWVLRSQGAIRPVRGFTYGGLIGALLCVGGLSLLHGPTEESFGVSTPAGLFINNVVLPLLGIGPVLWGLTREDTWLSRFLSTRLLVLLGKSSYVFYLIHMGVVQRLLSPRLGTTLTVLALYGLSILLYWFVEEPLNLWLRRALRKPAAEPLLAT
jgi:peptidoglycan/LPS O-acetylase OafA/YrhL